MEQLPSFNYGILDHQYIILKQINEGSFGKVYLVLTQKGQLYAAKIFNLPPNEFLPSYLNPLKKEINIISSLNHPNIIKYYSSGVGPIIINGQNSDDEKQYFIMEYANKGELYQYTKKLQKGFLEKYVKLLCWDIFNAVNFCHKKGIFNGDLKVENIVSLFFLSMLMIPLISIEYTSQMTASVLATTLITNYQIHLLPQT